MIAVLVVTILLLLVEHWFPWSLAIGRDLPKILAYCLGVFVLLAPISIYWLQAGLYTIVFYLWVIVVCGGLAVMLAYGIDWLIGRIAQARDLEQIEELHHGRGHTREIED